jgi:hypothetical protein
MYMNWLPGVCYGLELMLWSDSRVDSQGGTSESDKRENQRRSRKLQTTVTLHSQHLVFWFV